MSDLQRSEDTYFEVVEDKAVIVGPDGTELVTLNAVGTVVWECLDGEHDEAAITEKLAARFPAVERATLEADLRSFLAELRRLELVG
jgi:hypothetical protein